MNTIELLAPAGSFETARAAFAAGADAVYLGLDAFSARADAVNFSTDDLRNLLALARRANPRRRVYVTFNTLVDDAQLPEAVDRLALLEELGPDGLIVQDLGVARLVREHFPKLALHASTQLVAHNLEGVLALRELGFTRVVLARELSLADIRAIVQRSGVEIEVFVHGALCYSVSGLCLFSAMEKNRSGNRGKCAYCCRLGYEDAAGQKGFPFSMKDLRLDDRLDQLREAGVASLKIEGRMKSALYVASVTKRYRELLDKGTAATTRADLETVFSRRTTHLYIDGYDQTDVVDPVSLGHLGTPIGTVKRVTKDRDGRAWLRFHTARALERHDGLQFAAPEGGKPFGFGITEMRTALSRRNVFTVRAGEDVEILLPAAERESAAGTARASVPGIPAIRNGATVFCSASNEMKRRFPVPSFRPSDVPTGTPVDLVVTLSATGLRAETADGVKAELAQKLDAAQHPERTFAAVEKAFARLGTTDWQLGQLTVNDADRLFAPASALNELRRALVDELDARRHVQRRQKIAAALDALSPSHPHTPSPSHPLTRRILKLRLDQSIPPGDWHEIVRAIGHTAEVPDDYDGDVRLALPPFTREGDFAKLRARVKNLVRAGYERWEAADLATLRLLKACGIADITADWTLYAFNHAAAAQLLELGVTRFVASPENARENLEALSDLPIEYLVRQATPLFLSLTRPSAADPSLLTDAKGEQFRTVFRDGLWITTRVDARAFNVPAEGYHRHDISWDF